MGTTSFDIGVRTLECARCGAPIGASATGGEVACRYCGSATVVARRATLGRSRGAPTLADELARRSRLAAQLEHPIEPNPYAMAKAPRGLSGAPALAQLREAWTSAKGRAAAGQRGPAEQRELVWCALHLSEAELRQRNVVAARAVLETALDLLADAGHQHLVCCRLVTEAVRDGDLASADAWLLECDPAAEVLELDGAYREAAGRLRAAKGAASEVLEVVGESSVELPIAPEYATALGLLRASAKEALGRDDDAYADVAAACTRDGDAAVLAALAESGFAPRAAARRRRTLVLIAAAARDGIPVGARAVDGALASVPFVALALQLAVTIPRCTFDADPFLGAQGHLLCPHACTGCEGPFRVYTAWTHRGSKHSTNGPQYFCRTSSNRVETMTDAELYAARHSLGQYELLWAPAAATYLSLLLLLLPYAAMRARRRHRDGVAARDAKELEVARLAAEAGIEPPPRAPAPPSWKGVKWMAAAIVVPTLAILLELALPR